MFELRLLYLNVSFQWKLLSSFYCKKYLFPD